MSDVNQAAAVAPEMPVPGALTGVTARQWGVFAIVTAAWFFDCLDQRLFSLVRLSALSDILGAGPSDLIVQNAAKTSTALMLFGWGLGGVIAGTLGDRFGRSRVLTVSIALFSLGSGLTAVGGGYAWFLVLRFLTGVGMGGIFGLAVAILTETVRGEARLVLLAIFQIMSTVANMLSAGVKMGVERLAHDGTIPAADVWRALFAVSALPALLAVIAAIWLAEPEPWRARRTRGELPAGLWGGYRDLLADRSQRRNLVLGTLIAVAGVVGLWGIGEYATDLQTALFTTYYADRGDGTAALVAGARNWAYFAQMAGGAAGMALFGVAASRFGRRPAFLVWFAFAFAVTAYSYWRMETPMDAYWMMPLMGAAQFGLFAGFTIYLPELFKPAVRGTGVSFAYNAGRFAAAIGGLGSAWLAGNLFGGYAAPLPLRYAAMLMCAIFLIGFAAAWFAPETRGAEHDD